MSQTFKGFVARINSKSGNTNGKNWTVYSAKIEKADGTEYDEWVSLGFEKPKFNEGDYVEFEAEDRKGRLTFIEGSGKKPKNPPARKQKSKGGNGSGNGGGDFNRQTNPEDAKRMSYANARTAALETVALLLAQDALPITKATSKGNSAKRQEEIEAYINKYTVQFFNDGVTLRLLETVSDSGAVAPTAAPLPDADEVSDDDEDSTAESAGDEDEVGDDDEDTF